MSHPARGPVRSMGIDGKANCLLRPTPGLNVGRNGTGGRGMSHPARGPVRSMGIDGTANCLLRPTRRSHVARCSLKEAEV